MKTSILRPATGAMRWLFVVLFALAAPLSLRAQTLPPVVERYEQLLVRSPGKGTAFDKVYQHFFEGEGLEKLTARWKARAEAPGAGADAATYWLLLGVLTERQGNAPEAIRLYQKAADLKPAEARAWSALGDAQAAAAKMPEAIKSFQKALASNPTRELRPQLFRQLARTQQRAFDIEGAVKTWQQFIAESPDDPFVLEEAADALVEGERYGEAKAHYEKLRDLAGTDPYRKVMAIMKLAQLEEKQGHREQSRALYESALPISSPTSWMHREVRARIEESYRRQDDLPGLVTYYQGWLEKQAKDVDVALRLSDALLELNRKKEAVTWLRQAADWAPDRKEVLVALAKRLGEIDEPREAVQILTKLTQAHPEEESYREFLGDAHWQTFKLSGEEESKRLAIASWRQLAPPTTKDANKVGRVADLFRAKDLPAEALEHYARSVQLAPDVSELRQRWADFLFDLKRDEEGTKVMLDMVAGERATAPNYLRLARWQQRRQDAAAALDSVDKGLAKDPASFELMMLQWRLFADTEKWEQAAGMFERLLAAAPSVYSVDQVEDQHLQALRSLGRLEETTKQLAGRLGKEPALTESEMRLLLRLALQAGDLDTSGEALAEARQRFPNSAPLVRRQVEYEKRKGNLEGRIAALGRLVELQPKQKIEWLREIVRAYQDEGLWDKALTAAQRVIDEAPANPDSRVLAADLNFAAQRFDAGVAQLREAIKLSDKPNDLRLRLARAFLESGRGEEARQTFDAVFEAENDPKVRLSLTRQLAEVYAQQGRLDELIGRFRQRQRAEEGGWRYALYLAEIFQQMQDFAGAREELTKALGARSRDGNFLRQLMRLSEMEGNTVEAARFARLLAEVEPSEAHQVDLASALLNNRDTDEALKVLRANEDALLKNPMTWREVLLKFNALGAGAQMVATLSSSLASRPADWRGRLTLAEMQLIQAEWAGAERWLWQVVDMPPEPPAPVAAATTTPTAAAGATYAGSYYAAGRSKYMMRVSRSGMIRQGLMMAMQNTGSSRMGRFSYSSSYYGGYGANTVTPGTLEEARDAAIVYLAMIAQQQGSGEAFLTELDKRLAAKTRADRVMIYALIQAMDRLRREIELEAAQPSGDPELDSYCLQYLLNTAQRLSRRQPGKPEDLVLIETFFAREHRPEQMLVNRIGYHQILLQSGRTEEAKKVADEVLTKAETSDPQLMPIVFGFAVQREALDVAEKILPRLMTLSQQSGQSALKQQAVYYKYSLAEGLLKKKETVRRGVELLADMLLESYPTRLPMSLSSYSSFARRSYRAAWREEQPFPFPNRYLDESRIQIWRQIFDQLKRTDSLGEMRDFLNRHIQSLPDDKTIYAQLARACFWWWNDEKGDAMREVYQLARDLKDDDLRMMASTMLAEMNQPEDALKVLEEVSATTGNLAIDKQLRMLSLARKGKNVEKAREIALQLTAMRLDPYDEAQLGEVLQQLGLQAQADELRKKRTATRTPGSRNRLEDQLERELSAKNEKEALALSRAILARDPLATSRTGSSEDYGRRRALDALKTYKQIDTYRTELEKQLAESPSSVRTVYLLAEAYGRDNQAKALEYYRKLAELKPTDNTFQLRLALMLASNKQPEEAMRIWETVLARDTDQAMQTGFSQMYRLYQESKQLSRLAGVLVKLPKKSSSSSFSFAGFGSSREYSSYYHQLASELQTNGQTAEAIAVWRSATAMLDERTIGAQQPYLPALVAALIEIGDKAGAAAELDRYFFPEVKAKPIFGMDTMAYGRAWHQASFSGDGRMTLSVTELLRLASAAGSIDQLRAKAAAASSNDGTEMNQMLVLLIDTQRRDATTFNDFATRLRAAVKSAVEQHDYSALQMQLGLAQELRAWPEARRLALEVMVDTQKGFGIQGNPYYGSPFGSRAPMMPQTAELALELGEQETARTCLREWATSMRSQISSGGFDSQQVQTMNLMVRAGLTEEVQGLLKSIKENTRFKSDTDLQRRIGEFENRLALATGNGKLRVTAWPVASTGEEPTVLCWEIGAASTPRRDSGRNPSLWVMAEELPALDGRFEVELFHGPTASSVQRLVKLPAAKGRGTWTSPQPLGPGFVLAVARDKSQTLFSTAIPLVTGRNLLVNPTFDPNAKADPNQPGANKPAFAGWRGVTRDSVTVSEGGPRPGGKFTTLKGRPSTGRETGIAQRIPLEPGKEYLASGWMRYPANSGSAQLVIRLFDKDGKSLSQPYLPNGEADRWTYTQCWLTRGSRYAATDGVQQQIPDQAVEVEFSIQTYGGCDIDGLFFGEVVREAGK